MTYDLMTYWYEVFEKAIQVPKQQNIQQNPKYCSVLFAVPEYKYLNNYALEK